MSELRRAEARMKAALPDPTWLPLVRGGNGMFDHEDFVYGAAARYHGSLPEFHGRVHVAGVLPDGGVRCVRGARAFTCRAESLALEARAVETRQWAQLADEATALRTHAEFVRQAHAHARAAA
jgi:hypothetical protein